MQRHPVSLSTHVTCTLVRISLPGADVEADPIGSVSLADFRAGQRASHRYRGNFGRVLRSSSG